MLFKPVGKLTNLFTSRSLSSAFKVIKSFLTAKLDVLTPVASYNFFSSKI